MKLYIPNILVVRTNHTTEVRTQGKEVNEYTREFAWLGDKTIETIVQSVVHRLTFKEHSVIHCYHEGVPVYILGSLEYYHNKLSFVVISTLKSTRSYLPYRLVDTNNRFTFDKDLSTFDEIYDKSAYRSKIEAVKKAYYDKKKPVLTVEQRVKIAMKNLRKLVAQRDKDPKEEMRIAAYKKRHLTKSAKKIRMIKKVSITS